MLADLWNSFIAWLLGVVNAFAAWLWQLVQDLFLWVWDGLLSALAGVLAMVPVPDWIESAGLTLGDVPCGVVYLLEPFRFGVGLAAVMASYVIRFLIRRIPLIG